PRHPHSFPTRRSSDLRGTCLKPLTDTWPKPMVEIQGKPFLEYQIEQLREQGFERVLLLLGYLPEVVLNYFGNGRNWGIKIEYSRSEEHTSELQSRFDL